MSTVKREIDARRGSILKAWRADIDGESQAGCPANAGQTGRFVNPSAFLADECANDVLAWLTGEGGMADIPAALADWCRLRAVQDASPSQALRPLFDLKRIIRKAVGGADGDGELVRLEGRIDALALHAFDCYAESREKLFQIRVDEMQRGEGLMNRRLAREQARREGEKE